MDIFSLCLLWINSQINKSKVVMNKFCLKKGTKAKRKTANSSFFLNYIKIIRPH